MRDISYFILIRWITCDPFYFTYIMMIRKIAYSSV